MPIHVGLQESPLREGDEGERDRQRPRSPARRPEVPPERDDANAGQRGDLRGKGRKIVAVEESGQTEEADLNRAPGAEHDQQRLLIGQALKSRLAPRDNQADERDRDQPADLPGKLAVEKTKETLRAGFREPPAANSTPGHRARCR